MELREGDDGAVAGKLRGGGARGGCGAAWWRGWQSGGRLDGKAATARLLGNCGTAGRRGCGAVAELRSAARRQGAAGRISFNAGA